MLREEVLKLRELEFVQAARALGAGLPRILVRHILPGTLPALIVQSTLGMAGAIIAGLAWARSSLSVLFGDVPVADVLILLIGLPLIAAVCGWLSAGREPPVVARQPIE